MKTTIEINGKLYDARTGKVISSVNNSTNSSQKEQPKGVIMDGVARRKNQSTVTDLSKNSASPIKPMSKSSTKQFAQDIKRPKPVKVSPSNHHSAVHSAQRSQTLNRKAVKKPAVSAKPALHAKSATPVATIHSRVEHSATGRGMLMKKVPETRLVRAMSLPKSTLVSKFGKNYSKKPQLSPNLKVQQAPNSHSSHKANEPSLKNPVHQIDSSAAVPVKRSVFEDHLLKANSHQQKPVKKAHRSKRIANKLRISPKIVSVSAGVFAILLLGGFFAYQNVPSIGMRIAASKAGFSGKLPSNVPAGYAFKSPINAEPNNIALTYKSRSDDRQFIIVQRPTNWSSESLLTNYLLDSQFRYQVYRDKGLTVYIYNGSNATWVDKGVWYSVTSPDSALSSEQLLELASSI